MKRLSLMTFLFVLSACSHALNPTETRYPHKVTTVNSLYEACSNVGETAGGVIPFFDCESYVYGVLDAYLAVRLTIPLESRACFPEKIPPWQVLEEVRPLILKFDSKSDSKIAGTAIIEALTKLYPCGKSKQQTTRPLTSNLQKDTHSR